MASIVGALHNCTPPLLVAAREGFILALSFYPAEPREHVRPWARERDRRARSLKNGLFITLNRCGTTGSIVKAVRAQYRGSGGHVAR